MFGKIRYAERMRLLLIILLLPFFCVAALDLTPAEQTFVKEHPVIRTRFTNDQPPLEFSDEGEPAGFIIDYLNHLAGLAGFEIDFGQGPEIWEKIEQDFADWKIDMLTGTVGSERYDGYALLGDPYLYFRRVYVVRRDDPEVHSPEDLNGKTVAATGGLLFVDVWKKKYPEIRFLKVDTTEEMVLAVADGRADATFTLKSTVDYFSARHALINLRTDGVAARADGLEDCFRIAVRSDWPELRSIFNKAMAAVPQRTRDALWNKWFDTADAKPPIFFTDEERAYIMEHPVLRYSTLPDAPPLEYCNGHGTCIGLTHEYMKRVEQQTGIHLEHVPARTRAEKLENFRSGRCDFLPTFAPYDLSTNDFLCTETYMKFPLVIATRIDVPFINTLADCAGQRVALVARIGVLTEYQKRFPTVDFVGCSSVPDGLRDLSQGKLFGVIGPQPVVAHQIQELYLGNLKITGKLDESLSLCALVRPKDAPLRDILNKVFRSVPPEEQAQMLNRWISIRFEEGFDYRLFWKILAGAGGVLLLLLIRYRMAARYNRRLKVLNSELEQSLAERDRIMSVISHDLRQPVHGYNQMLALLQSGEINPVNEAGQRMLTQSRQRGELAIESMENLLNWLNVRRGVRHPVLLSPYRQVEDSRELLSASLENKQLRLENRIDPALRIPADEQRLAAILRNLINNSIKFSPSGAVIEVSAKEVANGLQLSVHDYGTGMDAETIRKILDGAGIESAYGTGGEKGTGMGLSLCRQFLKEVGAEFRIESSPGKGSTFSFILPGQASRTDC